jgi:hypothetical protein
MAIVFNATPISGLYSYTTSTEWKACYLPSLKNVKSVTLTQAFNQPASIFLFALQEPQLDNDFITKIYSFLNQTYSSYVSATDHCLVWLNQKGNPDVIDVYQTAQALIFNSNFRTKEQDSSSQRLWFNNRNFFAVAPSSQASIAPAQDAIIIQRTAVSLPTKYLYGLYLLNISKIDVPIPLGKIIKKDNDLKNEPPLTISFITTGSAIQFSIDFPLDFDATASYYQIDYDLYPYQKTGNNYTIMPIGFKYYYLKKGDLIEITYPIFKDLAVLNFQASFHPGEIFNPDYTYFAFTPAKTLATNLPTSYGKLLKLESNAASKLAFCKSPDTDKTSRYYWTLAGDFNLINATPATGTDLQNRLLCGLSGTETISFTGQNEAEPGDQICFKPGQPAVANVYPILNTKGQSKAKELLNSDFTTAWVSFKKQSANSNQPIAYHSQPADAPLFAPAPQSGILAYAEVASFNLAAQQQAYFPLVPSAVTKPVVGSRGKDYYTQEDIRQFEIQILNPARKTRINATKQTLKRLQSKKLKAKNDSLEVNLSTTPQGLLVNLTDDRTAWQSLTLANSTAPSTLSPLGFSNIDTDGGETGLQEAFQTNEQFLVIGKPGTVHSAYYEKYFQNKIDVAAWPFVLDLIGANKWTSKTGFNNIVIFKFCNYSLEDRVKNQKLWTDPLNFNDEKSLPALGNWLAAYIDVAKKAVDKDGDQSPFKNFVDLVTNKNWNGILCLQVTLELTSVPKEIKSILAGIDTTRFTAHHFGIEANHIALTPANKLDTDFKSSMFGLINYFDPVYETYLNTGSLPNPLPVTPENFEFKVLELQVLFEKSAVKDFKSKIQLSLNSLFDEVVSTQTASANGAINANSVVLNGLYDKRNGNTSYSFAITKPNQLELAGVAMKNANLLAVQLATVNETENAQLTTRFYISGTLAFNQLENFDLFSYDTLPFSNLVLDMAFDLNKLGADYTPVKTFTFSPGNLIFSKRDATSRDQSLAKNFPLDLTNLLYYNPDHAAKDQADITPSSLAYLPVDAPLATQALAPTWYALQFNVNLGSLGALTAKVGFNAEILLAWSPVATRQQVQIFIKMPFSGGMPDKGFSLQGILKFAVGDIMFINTPTGEGKMQYAMVFTQIGVSLMGLKLPKSGNTIFYLFGDPAGTQGNAAAGNLGWFGAYQAKKEKSKQLINQIS